MERRILQHTLGYHYSPQTTTNETPYRLTYGTDVMIPIEVGEPSTRRLLFQQQQNEENDSGWKTYRKV